MKYFLLRNELNAFQEKVGMLYSSSIHCASLYLFCLLFAREISTGAWPSKATTKRQCRLDGGTIGQSGRVSDSGCFRAGNVQGENPEKLEAFRGEKN